MINNKINRIVSQILLFIFLAAIPAKAADTGSSASETTTLKGKHVTIIFPTESVNNLKDPKAFLAFYDDAYAQMQELTSAHPPVTFHRGAVPAGVWGFASAEGVTLGPFVIPGIVDDFNKNKATFGMIHEMGHVFDARSQPRWYITPGGGGEEFANLKLSYVVDRLLRQDNQYRIDFGPGGPQTGWDFNNNYYLYGSGKKYLAGTEDWSRMSSDDLEAFHMGIIRKYGWDVFKKWFRCYPVIESMGFWAPPSVADPKRMILECAIFSHYTHDDLMPYYKKWRLPVTEESIAAANKTYHLDEVFKKVDAQYDLEVKNHEITPDSKPLNLIPWPKSVQLGDARITITPTSRIIAMDAELKPLAVILSGEIYNATGLRLVAANDSAKPAPGDIVLKINKDLKAGQKYLAAQNQAFTYTTDGAYQLNVKDQAVIEGFDYRAVAQGTATLLQSLNQSGDGAWTLRDMQISDWPSADYDAVMLDVARQWNSVDEIKQDIEICRLYKFRYLQLHLSDDNGWTFPSTAYPQLGSKNTGAHDGPAPKVYTLEELRDLVHYADERGVTLVPEMETPGHSGAARLAMPEQLDAPKTPGGPAWLAIMNMANDQMYPVLDTLVGEICDVFKSSPYFHIGCDECNLSLLASLPQTQQYLKDHGMKDVSELFAQHVKRMNDMVRKRGKMTIVWSGAALDPATMKDQIAVMCWHNDPHEAEQFLKQGFPIINVPWGENFDMNLYQCNGDALKPTDAILGGVATVWEQNGSAAFNIMRYIAPHRQEKTWGPDNSFDELDMDMRYQADDGLLSRLIHPVSFAFVGAQPVKDPTQTMPWSTGKVLFSKPLTIQLASSLPGQIRYTLDGTDPTTSSEQYKTPLPIEQDLTLKSALFDDRGNRVGFITQAAYHRVNYEKNITTGKPVTASGYEAANLPQNAVDGTVDQDSMWVAAPAPQWLQIDLLKVHTLDRVRIFPYWDGHRYYQYTVELSVDGKTWTKAVDMSQNTKPATPEGDLETFPPTQARYIRVNMLKNSANAGVHLIQVRAYDAK